MRFIYLTLCFPLVLLQACSKDAATTPSSTNNTTNPVVSETVPEIYKNIYGASSITSDGTYITIKTTGLPDHKSSYYATTNALYDNFSGTTFAGYQFQKNPNSIAAQVYVFKIPVNPKLATTNLPTAALLEKDDIREFYLGMKSDAVRGERRWKKKKQWR